MCQWRYSSFLKQLGAAPLSELQLRSSTNSVSWTHVGDVSYTDIEKRDKRWRLSAMVFFLRFFLGLSLESSAVNSSIDIDVWQSVHVFKLRMLETGSLTGSTFEHESACRCMQTASQIYQ
jgi:hypothetical protein